MNLSELPISSIEGHVILGVKEGKKSYIQEFFPLDYTQYNNDDKSFYVERLRNEILTTTNNYKVNDVNGSLLERIRDSSKKDCFKVYKTNDKYFIDAPLEIGLLDACPAKGHFDYFLSGYDDFYSNVEYGIDSFKLNGMYYRLINIYEFPEYINPFELTELGDQVVTFRRLQNDDAINKLEKGRKWHVGNLGKTLSDDNSNKAFIQNEELLSEISSGNEGLFETEMWFIIKSDNESDLNTATVELISDLRKLDVVPLIETNTSFARIVPTLFFGVGSDFKRSHLLTSRYLTNILPLHREFIYEDGIEFYSRAGNPIYLDNFHSSAENANISISGVTGSGKTVLGLKIIDYSRQRNRSVTIIDLGGSFQKYLEYHGGNIFSKTINPMAFGDVTFLKEFILSYIPENEITTKEKGRLFEEIGIALDCGITTFKELIKFLDEKIKEISYYFSEVWPYINNETFVKTKITYFDLSVYPKAMVPGVILFAINYFKTHGEAEDLRTLLIDECWSFLKRNADYLEECFRTFRKHGCAAIAITQNVEDLIELGKISSAILGSCNFQIYFRQDITTKSEAFVSEFDRENIKTLNSKKGAFSEFLVLIKNKGIRKITRYYATKLELGIFNSSDDERKKWGKFKNKFDGYFTYQEMMNTYVIMNNGGLV